jgi:Cytochrome P460
MKRSFTTIVLGSIGIAAFVALAVFAQQAPEKIHYPQNFQTSMARYATVDRADGKLYELYISNPALAAWRSERRLPPGALFVIESFSAQRGADGAVARDRDGRLLKGDSENEIHVSQKEAAWVRNGECTSPSLMGGRPSGAGQWRMAAFDPRSGQRILQASQKPAVCHQCHQDRRAEDFILSRGLLDSFVRSGQASYISFACGEREICFGGDARPLSAAEPTCADRFQAR